MDCFGFVWLKLTRLVFLPLFLIRSRDLFARLRRLGVLDRPELEL